MEDCVRKFERMIKKAISSTSNMRIKSLHDLVLEDDNIEGNKTFWLHVVPNIPATICPELTEADASKAVRYAYGWWLPEDGEFGRSRHAYGYQDSDVWMRRVEVRIFN